ncbi:hypothetical protein ACWXVL_02295 [Mycoplasma sp. 128]|uniref:hypothetical protein n=1 Tax=Mycoplasma sp. 3341 TaxID=3447506 RepID=UPI003F65ED94
MNKPEINEKLIAYFDSEIKQISKRIKFQSFFQSFFNFLIILINLTIIAICSFAIYKGQQILKTNKAAEVNVTISIIVASFTILIFILAIVQSIYKTYAKTYTYKKMYESIEFMKNVYIYDANFEQKQYQYNIEEIMALEKNKSNERVKNIVIKTLRGEKGE